MSEDCKLILGDCLEKMKELSNESIDLILADPPYDIEQSGKLTKQKGVIMDTAQAWGNWSNKSFEDYCKMIESCFIQFKRILKDGGSVLIWLDRSKAGYFWVMAEKIGFVGKNTIVWIKKFPMPRIRKNNYRSSFESCIWFSKGSPTSFNFINQRTMKNYFTADSTKRISLHPTEKPLDLIEWQIKIHSKESDLIFDPFMGSGTTGVAALKLQRKFVGIEINPEYFNIAEKRIGEWENQNRLFEKEAGK